MRRLSKRWESVRNIDNGSLYRVLLSGLKTSYNPEPLTWACIEFKDPKGPFRLEVWDNNDWEWEFVQDFPTLKKAKEVGRLLAGVALAKNF